jgi:hypothetical protein
MNQEAILSDNEAETFGVLRHNRPVFLCFCIGDSSGGDSCWLHNRERGYLFALRVIFETNVVVLQFFGQNLSIKKSRPDRDFLLLELN